MKSYPLKSTCSTTGTFFQSKKIKESGSTEAVKKENINVDKTRRKMERNSPSKHTHHNKENPY